MSAAEPFDIRDAEEHEWPRRIQAGDHAAYRAMFDRYYEPLCRYAYAFTKSEDAAEDVVQELFIRIWAQHETWNVQGPVRAYLFVGVRQRAISALRRQGVPRRHRERLLALVPGALDAGRSARADVQLETKEVRARLARAIASLPPRQREVFELSRSEDLTYEQIAGHMGISTHTVGVHMTRALAAVRRALAAYLAVLLILARQSL